MTLAPLKTFRVDLEPQVGETMQLTATSSDKDSTIELDSHADTSTVGSDALEVYDYNRPVNVTSYDPALGKKVYRTISAALGYQHPYTGEVYHLVLHQAVSIPHLTHHLLCPMQARVNDVTINELPKFLSANPNAQSHAIVIQDPDDRATTLTLPLSLRRVTSYLPTFAISREDWNSGDYPRLDLTSEHLEWDPNNTTYEEQENAMTDHKGNIIGSNPSARGPNLVINSISTSSVDAADFTDDDNFSSVLESNVRVALSELSTNSATGILRSKTGKQVDHKTLANRWGISTDRAKQTVMKTTQRGVRKCLNPTLSRRFPTNDRMLRYDRLHHPIFTDTLIAGTVSKRGNKYAQVYGTNFGWSRAYPMKKKSEAHESLSLLFKRDGVPPEMIMDGAREQISGQFRDKLKEANCHLKQLEPYSPWSNAAEGTIRELKRGASRRMLKTGTPKRLWDHCLELEALIRSNTALDIYSLDGETPETMMK
ncbi:hypothetical protein ACHAXR_003313, partial [Thalassiosira sp. AJA248-18]